MQYLKLEHFLQLHALLIQRYGGTEGVRDIGRLEAAVAAQSQVVFGDELYKGVFEKAAAVVRGVIADHPFYDGNKRTGMLAGLSLIELNGYTFIADRHELEDFAVNIATNHPSIEVIAEWLQAHSALQSGRESRLLDAIIEGRKTIEGRLNKGKFADYKVGDIVSLRRDIRGEDGVLRDGSPDAARVEVVAIRHYPSFIAMVNAEGYERVIPDARSAQEAADEYNKYYSVEDQSRFGVLAIEIRFIER